MNNLINYKLNDAVPFKTSSKDGVRCQGGGGQNILYLLLQVMDIPVPEDLKLMVMHQ